MNREKINKTIEELKQDYAEHGAILHLDDRDLIDDEHLYCLWYGGYIGSVEYNGYILDIRVDGDVQFAILDDEYYDIYEYRNRNNTGAYYNTDLVDYIHSDKEFDDLYEQNKIVWDNNNWIEYELLDKDGDTILFSADIGIADTDNVLEAFYRAYEIIDECIDCIDYNNKIYNN